MRRWKLGVAVASLALGLGIAGADVGCAPHHEAAGFSQPAAILPTVPATAWTTKKYGIVNWRMFMGRSQIVVTGYDADENAVGGYQVAWFKETPTAPAHLRVMMLDGTNEAVRMWAGTTTIDGQLSDNHQQFAMYAAYDFQQAQGASGALAGLSSQSTHIAPQPGAALDLGFMVHTDSLFGWSSTTWGYVSAGLWGAGAVAMAFPPVGTAVGIALEVGAAGAAGAAVQANAQETAAAAMPTTPPAPTMTTTTTTTQVVQNAMTGVTTTTTTTSTMTCTGSACPNNTMMGSGSGSGSSSGSGSGSGTDMGSGSGSGTDTGSGSGSGTDTGSGSGTDTGSGSGSDTGSGSGSGTDTGSTPPTDNSGDQAAAPTNQQIDALPSNSCPSCSNPNSDLSVNPQNGDVTTPSTSTDSPATTPSSSTSSASSTATPTSDTTDTTPGGVVATPTSPSQSGQPSGDNTGTQDKTGTQDNAGTQDKAGTQDNTGTQDKAGTQDNTGTQTNNNTGSQDNTSTQDNGAAQDNSSSQGQDRHPHHKAKTSTWTTSLYNWLFDPSEAAR